VVGGDALPVPLGLSPDTGGRCPGDRATAVPDPFGTHATPPVCRSCPCFHEACGRIAGACMPRDRVRGYATWPHPGPTNGGKLGPPHPCPPEMGLRAGRIRALLAPPLAPISRETTTLLALLGLPMARRHPARPLLSAGHRQLLRTSQAGGLRLTTPARSRGRSRTNISLAVTPVKTWERALSPDVTESGQKPRGGLPCHVVRKSERRCRC
jgi:hypothetical protein